MSTDQIGAVGGPRGSRGIGRSRPSGARLLPSVPLLVLAAVIGVATPLAAADDPQVPVPVQGGTLRVVLPRTAFAPDFGDPSALDPLNAASMPFHRCCLTRTLLSHNGRRTAEGGAELHPDLAESLPAISPDGREWTFTLRPGLRYGPPLEDVPIIAADLVRGFHRALSPTVEGSADVAYLLSAVEGATAYAAGEATSIAGVEAPDERTLVVRLSEPSGSFAAKLALPLVVPIPPFPGDPSAPLGIAEGRDAGMGPFIVSSGPYMLEGSEAHDPTKPPGEPGAMAGLPSGGSMVLVRNPSWDPASDALRPAYPARIEFVIGDAPDDALAAVEAGRADLFWHPSLPPTVPPDQVARFSPERTFVDDQDSSVGLAMNVAAPPFDDVHVRRALNYVMDKRRLVDLAGGPYAYGEVGHIAPDSLLDNLLLGWDPYATPGHRGDIDAARAEMARSRYDSDGDGVCDAAACRAVRAVTFEGRSDTLEPWSKAILEALATIGIELTVDVLPAEEAFSAWFDPLAHVPMFLGFGWLRGELNASSYFLDQFHSSAISPERTNGTLVGATPEQLAAWGFETTVVPSVDARIEACLPLVGAPQFECWAAVDQYLMAEVVPWVPVATGRFVAVTSARVTSYSFDQLAVSPAFDRIAVSP